MASREYLIAVNSKWRSGGLEERGPDMAEIQLAQNLARRLDRLGDEDAPLNLLRLYDAALTKLQRAIDRAELKRRRDAGEKPASAPEVEPAGPPTLTLVEESPLERIRREKRRHAG